MNILLDSLPETVNVCGLDVPIHSDHRSCIRAHIALTDSTGSDQEALEGALRAFYDVIPSKATIDDAVDAMIEFLGGAPVPELPGMGKELKRSKERAYSFEYDQERILAAFLQQYSIDLTQTTLHWWVFLALLGNLYENQMANVMAARTEVVEPKASKETKKQIAERKKKLAIPERESSTEKEERDALKRAINEGDWDEVDRILGN